MNAAGKAYTCREVWSTRTELLKIFARPRRPLILRPSGASAFAWHARQKIFPHFTHAARHDLQTRAHRSSHSSSGCALPKQPSHHGDSTRGAGSVQPGHPLRFLADEPNRDFLYRQDRVRTSPGSTRIFNE